MGLKDFNYKQFSFDYGEKIGLAVAGTLALLLLLPLLWPGSGLFAPSASGNADELTKDAAAVTNGLNTNKPGPEDNPPTDIKDKLVAFAFDILPDGRIERDYRVPGVFDGRRGGPGGRQMPSVLPPAESEIALVRFQLPALVYSSDWEFLMTLKTGPMTGGPGMNPNPGGTNGPSSMMPPPPGRSGFGPGSLQGGQYSKHLKSHNIVKDRANQEEKAEHDFDVEWKKTGQIKDLNAEKLAMQPVPVRAAEIVVSFPYGAQIDEFMTKLGLPNREAVLAEYSATEKVKDEKGQESPARSFRFLGYDVQRRQVDAEGRPIDQGAVVTTPDAGWKDLDLKDAYAPLIVLSGGPERLEKETPRVQKVAFTGLTLPKLPTFGDLRTPPTDEYPNLEDKLPNLKKTMEKLDATPTTSVAKPSFTQAPDDLFSIPPGAGVGPGPGGMGPGGPGPGGTGGPLTPPMPMGGVPSGGTTRPNGPTLEGSQPGASAAQGVIPDYCLIRLLDFTVEPGKTYQYRLRVKMANPNFGRKDVASQGIASEAVLTPKDWYQLPKTFTVPSDMYFYAVDQAKLDPKDKDKDKDKEAKLPSYSQPIGANQTVVQIQKWVDFLAIPKRAELAIGDWVIAERVMATRGEPIGPQRVEAPYWRKFQDRFTMATDQPPPKANDKKHVDSVEVAFTPVGQEPILVDFVKSGLPYARTHPKTDDAPAPAAEAPVEDPQAPEQVLLYTPDGKLLAHDTVKDAVDPERVKRLEDVRGWIENVKKSKSGGKEDGGLFGGPKPGGTGPSN